MSGYPALCCSWQCYLKQNLNFFSKISSKRFAICDLGYILSNMHQQVQSCFGKPTWRNWQTRTVQVRVPRGMRVRLPPSVPFIIQGVINTPRFQDLLRVWHNGCAPAFQAGYTGSTPVTRSICRHPMKIYGWIPERSKGADCKSASDAFGGSNPPPATILR